MLLVFEDETIITQKPCIRKSIEFFEGEQQKIEHDGSRKNFSAYISMVWPEEKLMYNFYDEMNSINTMDHLENLKSYAAQKWLVEKTDTDMGQCFIPFEHDITKIYQYTERLANRNSSSKEGSIFKSK